MEEGKIKKDLHSKNKLKFIKKWLNTKKISLFWVIIIFTITVILFSILAIWTPWILLSLIFFPILIWIFTYEDKIISNFELKPLEKESLQEVKILSTLKEITLIISLKMDAYEILLLKYRRLRHRMLGIKIIKLLIYILFAAVIILIVLNLTLTEFSGYWQIQSMISIILAVLFTVYTKVDRIKRRCIPFKNWLKLIQQQITIISNNSIIKSNLAAIKEELSNLNERIDRFKTFFNPAIKIFETIGYLITIITTFITLFINRITALELILYLGISIFLIIVALLIPSFYYFVIDSNQLKHSEEVINVNSKMDLILKKLSEVYFPKKNSLHDD
ncbi:hypothetical protein LCGC14_0290550 [marine sediment metagenome]|uniref:Uncharacterized protein n=1 Tax=marine sediment metagenome TaxID=412755 RepID=A0A0F9WEE2_9ZZZZ